MITSAASGLHRGEPPVDTTRRKASAIATIAAACIYLAVALGYLGLPVLVHMTTRYVGSGHDPVGAMWFLEWWAYALAHRLNPLWTHYLWAPGGANVTWMTPDAGPGLLGLVLTRWLGTVAAYNIWMITAPAVAAFCTYLLCQSLTGSFWPSLVAGYLFGFSSYELREVLAHLNLALIFFIPLTLYLLIGMSGRVRSDRLRILIIGLVLSVGFITSAELFATFTMLFGVVAALAYLTLPPVRQSIRERVLGVCIAYAVALILISPYVYYMLRFPLGAPAGASPATHGADLWSVIVPPGLMAVGGHAFASMTRLWPGDWLTTHAYVGLPLLAVVALHASGSVQQRRWPKLFVTAVFLVVLAASMGAQLRIGGRTVSVWLWAPASHLPFIRDAIPARLALYADLVGALIAAQWLASRSIAVGWRVIVGLVCIAVLVPNLSIPGLWWTSLPVPRFFQTSTLRTYVPRDANVLVIDRGYTGFDAAYQVTSGMYFRMPVGYGGQLPGPYASWPIVEQYVSGVLDDGPAQVQQFQAFLGATGVRVVLMVNGAPPGVEHLLTDAGLIHAGQPSGDVSVYDVPTQVVARFESLTVATAARQALLEEFTDLFTASQKYLACGGHLADVSPLLLESRSLLSQGYGGYPRSAGNWNWTTGGGYASPEQNATLLGIGVRGSYDQVLPIINRFGGQAVQIFYPYPVQYVSAGRSVRSAGSGSFLLMRFHPARPTGHTC